MTASPFRHEFFADDLLLHGSLTDFQDVTKAETLWNVVCERFNNLDAPDKSNLQSIATHWLGLKAQSMAVARKEPAVFDLKFFSRRHSYSHLVLGHTSFIELLLYTSKNLKRL